MWKNLNYFFPNGALQHLLHLDRMEKEKATLLYIVRFTVEYNGKGVARLCSTILCEPIVRENAASSVGVEKKQFVVHQKKKNTDCPDITKTKGEKIQISDQPI